ncbi:ATP-binding protein, partial [Streptomyces sp. G35A]
RAAAPRPAPTAEETKARTARFSSFRQAVRAAAPDGADTGGTDPGAGEDTTPGAAPAAQPTPPTPEGDTTS